MREGSAELWFDNLAAAPDVGISKALELLGFAWTEREHADDDPAPLDALRTALQDGPVVLGPVDMGYLTYVPFHRHAQGADHFILAYAVDDTEAQVHDPAGYPHASLPIEDLAQAWRAERVPYRRGAYRSWAAARRVAQPSEDEIYAHACDWFATCYRATGELVANGTRGPWLAGAEAIMRLAEGLRGGDVLPGTRGHLVNFALQLGARRALDYAAFFDTRDPDLAGLKRRQAQIFGRGHTLAARDRWPDLAEALAELAEVEDAFHSALLRRAASPVSA
jgi:hypothetical protein